MNIKSYIFIACAMLLAGCGATQYEQKQPEHSNVKAQEKPLVLEEEKISISYPVPSQPQPKEITNYISDEPMPISNEQLTIENKDYSQFQEPVQEPVQEPTEEPAVSVDNNSEQSPLVISDEPTQNNNTQSETLNTENKTIQNSNEENIGVTIEEMLSNQ